MVTGWSVKSTNVTSVRFGSSTRGRCVGAMSRFSKKKTATLVTLARALKKRVTLIPLATLSVFSITLVRHIVKKLPLFRQSGSVQVMTVMVNKKTARVLPVAVRVCLTRWFVV